MTLKITGPKRELRVVERSANRQIHINHAMAVGQQGCGQPHRQVGWRTFDRVAKGQLLKHQFIRRQQAPIGLNLIGDIHAGICPAQYHGQRI